jgi:uncharacterized protein (TIGR03083 family)
MKQPAPILVADRFPGLLDALLELLSSLSPAEWELPTACAGWSVADIARHLLGDDIGMLTSRRDDYRLARVSIASWDDLVIFINQQNARWVESARRIGPRLLCDMLRLTGEHISAYFQSLDPYALGGPVDWAGPEPAPIWLDLAREFTERWHHQQHIRDAVGRTGITEPRYLAPVLNAFVRALPHTYRKIDAAEGTLVALTITGAAGGRWFLIRDGGAWHLCLNMPQKPQAEVVLDQDRAWRLFTKGVDVNTVREAATLYGDTTLAAHMLDMVSIIA